MDLIGLEDDPDFWNMTLDNSDVVKNEPPLTIEGELNSCLPRHFQISVALDPERVSSRPESNKKALHHGSRKPEPKPRSDGRYDCNHTCMDKAKCQHLWYVDAMHNYNVIL